MEKLLLLSILIVLPHCISGELLWERIHNGTGLAPPPRMDMGFGYDEVTNKIIVFGGRPGPTNDTWIFDVSIGIWRQVAVTRAPDARFSMVTGVSKSYFYVSTGEGANKKFFNDIWRFDFRTEEWDILPAQRRPNYLSPEEWKTRQDEIVVPRARYGAVGGIYRDGGEDFFINMGIDVQRMTHTYSYNIPNQRWKLENGRGHNSYNPSYPHARCLHAGTMIDKDEFILFGGCLGGGGTGGPCPAGDSWRFNARSSSWKRLPGCAAPSMFGSMAMLQPSNNKRRVIMYGGIDTSDTVVRTDGVPADQVAVFDPDTDEWTLRSTVALNVNGSEGDSIPLKRGMAGMATARNGIFMFGGSSRPHKPEGGEAKSSRRRLWECIHHFGGRVAIILALVNISLGVFLSVTSRTIWIIWFAYLGFVVFCPSLVECCRSIRGRRAGPIKYKSDEVYLEGMS